MCVMKTLRACVPDLSNEEVDADGSDALTRCLTAAKVKYGDIFYASIRTVYNKMAGARDIV